MSAVIATISKPHWSVDGLAERWGVSRVTVYSELKRRKALILKFGRLSRIPHDEVERIEKASASGFSAAPSNGKRKPASFDADTEALT